MEPASIRVRMNWKETYSIADRGCPTAIRKGKEGGHVTYRNFERVPSDLSVDPEQIPPANGKMVKGKKKFHQAELWEGVSDGNVKPAPPRPQLCFQSPLQRHWQLYKFGIGKLVKEFVPDLPGERRPVCSDAVTRGQSHL